MAFATYPSLQDRVVFITGGATGIGAAFVQAFHDQGSKVAFVDLDEAAGQALAARLGATSWFRRCDVTDAEALQGAIRDAAEALGPITVLINNVANDTREVAGEVTPEAWRKGLAVNLDPAFIASTTVYPIMKAAGGGAIVNLGSINAILAPAGPGRLFRRQGGDQRADQEPGPRLGRRPHPGECALAGLGGDRPSAGTVADATGRGGLGEADSAEGPDHARRHRPGRAVPGRRRQPHDDRPEPDRRRRADLMAVAALLACDWGTTNLRAWTLDGEGAVVAQADFPLGVSKLALGEAARRFASDVRPALGAEMLPAVLCGMIGSNLGWTTAPYADCPAGLADLAGGLIEVAPDVRIVPGLRCEGIAGAPDVMRGEETQILGWLAQHPERRIGRHLLCHPGTHAKWVLIEDGRIARFITAMTGELFAVLGQHSVLRSDAPADNDAAFDAGVVAAGDGGALAARLFSARARVVGGQAEAASTPSYLSGLLIGAEIAAVPALLGWAPSQIALLGAPALCVHYGRALRQRGVESEIFDGEAAAIAGLWALYAN